MMKLINRDRSAPCLAVLLAMWLSAAALPSASAFIFDGDANNGSIILTTGDGLVHWLKHDPISQIQGQFSTNVSVDAGVTDRPVALAVGDFDGDNNGDILIARSGGDLLDPNKGFLTWVERTTIDTLTGVHSFNVSPANSVAIGEMGDGGHADVIVGRDDGFITWAYKSPGFDAITAYHSTNQGDVTALAMGNFDGDADGDVLVAKQGALSLNWTERSSINTLSGVDNFNVSPANSIAIGNGDGDLLGIDEVFVGRDDGWVTWAFWNGENSPPGFPPKITACPLCNFNTGGVSGVIDLAFENVLTGDLSGDTSGDLFVINHLDAANGQLLWLKTDAFNSNIQAQDTFTIPLGLGTSLTSVDAGDFDGDGDVDIIVGKSDGGGVGGSVAWYEVEFTGGGVDGYELVEQQAFFNVGAEVLDLKIVAPEAAPFTDSADFDESGLVDGLDFLAWQEGLGVGTTKAEGDANNSGTVDAADFAIWEAQFGTPGLAGGVSAVPEPNTAVLLMLGLLALASTKSRR